MSMPKNDNVHHGHRSRTRDRVEVNGPESLLDHEMLEMLLYAWVVPLVWHLVSKEKENFRLREF